MRISRKVTKPLVFSSRNAPDVIISSTAYRALLRYMQKPDQNETGGVIAGRINRQGIVFLERFMRPSKRNLAGKTWLERDLPAAQRFINRTFKATKGLYNYLGEWHTHPEPNPKASGLDIKMMADILRNSILEIDFVIGVILGDTGKLYLWYQTKTTVTELKQRSTN